MSRLGRLQPRVGSLPQRLASAPDDERARSRTRQHAAPWRRWYKTARWQSLRWTTLTRDMFTCQMPGCGRIESDTSRLVADHRVPHRGDARLFWSLDNLQCLCKPCHDGRKQALERGGAVG